MQNKSPATACVMINKSIAFNFSWQAVIILHNSKLYSMITAAIG